MQRIIKKIALLTLLTTGLAGGVYAQTTADLSVSGMAAESGNYPGFVYSSSLEVSFANNSFNTLNANSFRIQLALPNGVEFDATYPNIPAGWTYTKIGPTDAKLVPAVSVGPLAEAEFSVPFKTTQNIGSTLFTAAQIVIQIPITITDPTPGNNLFTTTIVVQNTPLPVQFHSFNAKAEGCDVKLEWVTTNEVSNAYFNVERSADGTFFESVAKVNANMGATDKAAYSYVDKAPLNGTNFYRVSQVDIDGKHYTTSVVSAKGNCNVAPPVELFPNPATEVVNVKGLSGANTIRLFNILGQQIMEETATADVYPVKVNRLTSGTYQVQVIKGGKTIFNGKFVKAD
jgi:hypothetical protein